MGYSTWLLDVVRREFRDDRDVTVDAVPGWRTRGSSAARHAGVMDHHTGSPGAPSRAGLINWFISGYPWPPACNIATFPPRVRDVDGYRITIVAAGKANHAGDGKLGWIGEDEGNALDIGIEHYSTQGDTSWDRRHLEIQMRLDACLLEHMGQSWQRRSDHKEYALPRGRKQDRHHIDTAQWDRDLRDLMAARAAGASPSPKGLTVAEADRIIKHLDKRVDALTKTVKKRTNWKRQKVWDWLVDGYREKGAEVDMANLLKKLRRDADEARTNSAKALAVAREIAENGRLTGAELDVLEAAIEDTLAAGIDVDITVGG